jgi:hypothetical protein
VDHEVAARSELNVLHARSANVPIICSEPGWASAEAKRGGGELERRSPNEEATVTSALTASRWPLALSLRSGQLTVNSFCMPMKACGVPSGPETKHRAA